jgi:hypothetical protein
MAASVASSASKRSRSDNGATLTKDDTSDNTKRLKPATSSSSGGSEGKSGVSLLVSSVSHGGTDGKEATYLRGFGGEFSSEALHDALPKIGSTPQKYQPFHHRRHHLASASPNSLSVSLPATIELAYRCWCRCAYGLYAEQLSGTSFTTPRALNQRV